MPEFSDDKKSVTIDGVRLDLYRESRWSRWYHNKERGMTYGYSRFMDGSASISLSELESNWDSWDQHERIDFCQNLAWASDDILRDILRFIMKHGGPREWAGCALSIGRLFPKEEVVGFFSEACRHARVGELANLMQVLAATRDPSVHRTISRCLDRVWKSRRLFDDQYPHAAMDAVYCMKHLLELGSSPDTFRAKREALLNHPNELVRTWVIGHLHRFFYDPNK